MEFSYVCDFAVSSVTSSQIEGTVYKLSIR